jgi:predicted nucleic acid-binding protein
VIVDAPLVIDAVADPGPLGDAARNALAEVSAAEPLLAPGHFPIEIMSGLWAAANRPGHPFAPAEVEQAIDDAAALGVELEPTLWVDVRRAWTLSRGGLRYADAIYVAAAERRQTSLLTTDARIGRSGAPMLCAIRTVQA